MLTKISFRTIVFITVVLSVFLSSSVLAAESKKQTYQYTILKNGDIRPEGWIKEQIEQDLLYGFIGDYEKICSNVDIDLFVNKRVTVKKQYTWWSGEHEGYWKEAIIRQTFLTDKGGFKERAEKWMHDIVNAQEKDGYIGMYDPESRLAKGIENGELWTQSRIFAAMLAYYEYTNDASVLNAVRRAVDMTMEHYQKDSYFKVKKCLGGTSHAPGYFDILEWLYRITGEQKYGDYAVWLYGDFCKYPPRDNDLTLENLLNENYMFKKHGAHICEGFFMPFFVGAVSGDPIYFKAANAGVRKLNYHLAPSGAMQSDENVNDRAGTANELYEYCTMTEFAISLPRAFQFAGNWELGDILEKMTFNAAQGARTNPSCTAISYLTKDNRKEIKFVPKGPDIRWSYGPSHPAMCCTLNANRLMPYYVESMWMKTPDESALAAVLYGPSVLKTSLKKKPFIIRQETNYPFSDEITFKFEANEPVNFAMHLRVPAFSKGIKVLQAPAEMKVTPKAGYLLLQNDWKQGDVVNIKFDVEVEKKKTLDNEYYYQRGPLVYAIPLKHRFERVQEVNHMTHAFADFDRSKLTEIHSGFYYLKAFCLDETGWDYKFDPGAEFRLTALPACNVMTPWSDNPLALQGTMLDPTGKKVDVTMVPMGCTVLRRVAFPAK